MKRKIRMIAFDLDSTLLTEDKVLTPRTRKILEYASSLGIELLTTTGRSLSGIPDAVKVLPGAHHALTSNGSAVYKRKDNSDSKIKIPWNELPDEVKDGLPSYILDINTGFDILFETTIDHDRGIDMMKELSALNVMPDPFINGRCYIREDKLHLLDRMDISEGMRKYLKDSRTVVSDMDSFLQDKDIQKITINFASDENHNRIDLEGVEKIIERYPEFVAVTGGIRNIEISDKHATKGEAMLRLADILDIQPEEIIAFGDSENDDSMLMAAGVGVAMANSLPHTLDVADDVTLSNEEEGVAAYLEKIL